MPDMRKTTQSLYWALKAAMYMEPVMCGADFHQITLHMNSVLDYG